MAVKKRTASVNRGGKPSPIKRSVKYLWYTVLGGMGLFLVLLLGANFGLFGSIPTMQELENPQANLASEIYANNGTTLMGKIYAENRSPVDFKDISPNVIKALIATEDERFYNHSGIDAKSLARAVWGMGKEGGGSTITQQLAKNLLNQGRGSILRRGVDKLKEWIVALKLERNFTKQEILSLYLNRVAWGNVYGIRNASRVFYQKEPAELTTDEAALLVGMLKGPGQYDPVRHPRAALERRNVVLDQMVRNNVLSEVQANGFKKKPLDIRFKKLDENVGIAPYFRAVLAKQLMEWSKTHEDPKTGRPYDVYRDGLKIYTTIDPKMQLYAEEAVIQHMTAMQKKFNSQVGKNVWKGHEDILLRAMKESERWKQMAEDEFTEADIKKSFSVPVRMKIFTWNKEREKDTVMTPLDSIKYLKQMMQTGFAAMDPVSGEVKAWVGGVDFKWFKFDHVTANRQVGSTFKPLLYTLALIDAGLTPESYIGGRSITLANKTISGAGGTMAYCLAKSLNAAAYDLMSRIGPRKTAEFAHQAGIKSNIPVVPSIALGSADLTLLEMLHSYTMFPNRGFSTTPVIITRIEDKSGNLLESFQPETKQVISEADAYTMYKMMQGVVDFDTGHSMRGRFGITSPMGGKTGTTNDNTDGWFIGYTPQLLAGAWVGCDDPFLKIRWTYGGNEMAMPEYAYFMQKVYKDKSLGIDPKAEFQRPAELDNNPIYADQNFNQILRQGEGSEFPEDEGNGDAMDYVGSELSAPVESEFNKTAFDDMNSKPKDKGGNEGNKTDPKNAMNPDKAKADSSRTPADKKETKGTDPGSRPENKKDIKLNQPLGKPDDKKDLKITPPLKMPDDKNKKGTIKPPAKQGNDY